MAIKLRETKVVKHEPRKLDCAKCRTWVESMEKDPSIVFAADGTFQVGGPGARAWVCPACRGDVKVNPEASDVVERREASRAFAKADRAATREVKEMKRAAIKGPIHLVSKREPGSATTERGTMECGHVFAIMKGAKQARCKKCKEKTQP